MPMLVETPSVPHIISLTSLVFMLIFLRTALLDLIAFQGDLILGRETLPILIGTDAMRRLAVILTILGSLVFASIAVIVNEPVFLVFLLNMGYYIMLLYIIDKLNYLISLKYEALVDLNLLLVAVFYYVVLIAAS